MYTGEGQEIELSGSDSFSPAGSLNLAYLWCISGPLDMLGTRIDESTKRQAKSKVVVGSFTQKSMLAQVRCQLSFAAAPCVQSDANGHRVAPCWG